MLVGEAYDEQTVSQIGNPELRSVGEGLEMKAPKFSKLALGAVIIFACLAIPAFAQRGGGSHGGGGGRLSWRGRRRFPRRRRELWRQRWIPVRRFGATAHGWGLFRQNVQRTPRRRRILCTVWRQRQSFVLQSGQRKPANCEFFLCASWHCKRPVAFV